MPDRMISRALMLVDQHFRCRSRSCNHLEHLGWKERLQQLKEFRQCVGMFTQPFLLLSLYSDRYRPLPHRIAYRINSACKGANGAIPEIAGSPATPNAWPRRAVLTPIAGSIPNMRSRPSGVAPIGSDTEWTPTGSSVHFPLEQSPLAHPRSPGNVDWLWIGDAGVG